MSHHLAIARQRWTAFQSRAQGDAASWDNVFSLLEHLHEIPNRAYHNIGHVQACLDSLRDITDGEPPIAAELALWFHDAVYVVGATNNEQASAELCKGYSVCLGISKSDSTTAREAILATQHGQAPEDAVSQLVVDADLSILGSPPEQYSEYTQQIRQEWAHVPDDAFAAGRAKVMQDFLDREFLYSTTRGRSLYEKQARQNISDEIKGLKG